jgi:hypothetical protein
MMDGSVGITTTSVFLVVNVVVRVAVAATGGALNIDNRSGFGSFPDFGSFPSSSTRALPEPPPEPPESLGPSIAAKLIDPEDVGRIIAGANSVEVTQESV